MVIIDGSVSVYVISEDEVTLVSTFGINQRNFFSITFGFEDEVESCRYRVKLARKVVMAALETAVFETR